MGRKRKCIKTEKEKKGGGKSSSGPTKKGWKQDELDLLEIIWSWKLSAFFWALYIHQGFINMCLFLLQLLYQYISVAPRIACRAYENRLLDPLTVSDSVGTKESAFLTRTFKMLLVQELHSRTTVYAILKNNFCVFFFYLKQPIASFKISVL